jgi:hypothetical protein
MILCREGLAHAEAERRCPLRADPRRRGPLLSPAEPTIMRTTLGLLLATAGVAAAHPLHAQPDARRAATVDGVAFSVPPAFSPVPALSDGTTAVYADTATHVWLFVATLHAVEERRALFHRLASSLGARVFGARGGVEWRSVPSAPTSPFETFRQRLSLQDGNRRLSLTFRQYRSAGRDVVAGSAFVTDAGRQPSAACEQLFSYPAGEAEAALTTSLLRGTPAPEVLPNGSVHLQEAPPAGAAASAPLDPEQERVREVFKAYLKALMGHDGAAVAPLAAPAVVEHYAELRRLAVYGAPGEVRALPLRDRMEVLRLRHREDAAKLITMTPLDLLAADMSTMETDGSTGTGVPHVRGGVAWVSLTWNGKPTGQEIYFVRREGAWLVDFLSMLGDEECELQQELRLRGVGPDDENGVLLLILGEMTGRPVSPDIWQPLVRTEGGA